MSEVRFADVIVPEVFTPYVLEKSLLQNRFFQSGILTPVAQLNAFLAAGGKTFNIPFWKDLSGDLDVPSETVDTTINNITTDKMVGIRQLREKAWGANDMAAAFAGSDPAGAIGARVAGFWAHGMEDLLIYTIRGVIADNVANDSSDLVNDISIEDGAEATAANKISAEETINAVMKQGDMFNDIVAIAIHSAVYSTLVTNNLIDFIPDSEGQLVIPTYMGLRLIVSDNCYRVAAGGGYKYHSYLFKSGAVGFGSYGGPIQEVEAFRNPNVGMGVDVLFTRRQFAIQPLGFSWVKADNTALTPADAALYAAASWDRVYNLKNTGIVALISNL
jgi:hypothetical protein